MAEKFPSIEWGEERDQNLEADVDLYIKGIPIFEKMERGDRPLGNPTYQEKETLRALIDMERRLSDEKINEILKNVTLIRHTKNLLFHHSSILRAPLISKTGILSREVADRITQQKYGGFAQTTSGWGSPIIGRQYVDVLDPTLGAGFAEASTEMETKDIPGYTYDHFKNYKKIKGKVFGGVRKRKKRENQGNDLYQVDEQYSTPKYVGHGGLRMTYIIKMLPERFDKIIRWRKIYEKRDPSSNWQHPKDWSYVEHRIKPEELVGIIVTEINLLYFSRLLEILDQEKEGKPLMWRSVPQVDSLDPDRGLKWDGKYSKEEVIELLGTTTEMPIYDSDGNLLWPKQMSHTQIAGEVAKERGKLKDDNK